RGRGAVVEREIVDRRGVIAVGVLVVVHVDERDVRRRRGHGGKRVDAVANGGGDRLDQRSAGRVRVDGYFLRCCRRGQKTKPEADRRLRDIEVDVPLVVALRELPEA